MLSNPASSRLAAAILCRIGAVIVLGSMSALIKLAAERGVNTFEITFFRNAFAFVPLVIYVGATRSVRALHTRRPLGHLVRSLIGVTAMVCSFSALGMLPLTEVTAISFASPLFITALSVPVLGEKVGPHRWAAVVVGFVGVLVMMRPDPTHLVSVGALLALASALGSAGAMLAIRQLGATEPGVTIVFYFTLAATLVGAAGLPFVWVTPDPPLLGILVACGLLGGVGQMLLTQAYRLGPAAVIAPFDYTALLWAGLLGYLVWMEIPTLHTIVGGLIVMASSLYVVFRERRAQARAAADEDG